VYRSSQTERDNNSINSHAQYTTVRTFTFSTSVTGHNHLMAWFGPATTLPRPQLFSSVDKSSNQTDHSPSVNAHTIVTHSLPVKCGSSRPLAPKTNAGKSWRGCLSLQLVSWPLATHSRVPIPGVPDWHMRQWWCTVKRAKLITDLLFPQLVYLANIRIGSSCEMCIG
jgi:hypothetical protein